MRGQRPQENEPGSRRALMFRRIRESYAAVFAFAFALGF